MRNIIRLSLHVALLLLLIVNEASAKSVWQSLDLGLASSVQLLSAAPNNENVMYLNLVKGGFYRTLDGGAHWKNLSQQLPTGSSFRISSLVVIDANTLLINSADKVYRSMDGGSHWVLLLFDKDVNLKSINYAGNQQLLLRTKNSLYRSFDNGDTWQLIHEGSLEKLSIVKNSNPSILFSISDSCHSNKRHLLVSHNGGETWYNKPLSLNGVQCVYGVKPLNMNVLYLSTSEGLFKSTDSGEMWQSVTPNYDNPYDEWPLIGDVSVVDKKKLYVSVLGHGLFRSDDGAKSWTRVGRETLDPNIYGIYSTPESVFAISFEHGLKKSVDEGASWQTVTNGINGGVVEALVVDKQGAIYAATHGGLFKHSVNTSRWQSADKGIASGDSVLTLSMAADRSVLYAHAFGDGLYKSTSAGQSWLRLTEENPFSGGLIHPVSLYAANDEIVYDINRFRGSIKSVDGGTTWQELLLPFNDESVRSTVFINEDESYMATPNSLYHSVDGGLTWTMISTLPNDDCYEQTLTVVGARTIYFSCNNAGLFKSEDAGKHWFATNQGLPKFDADKYARVTSMSARNEKELYVSPAGFGVYQSLNGGKTWKPFNKGFNHRWVSVLTLSGDTLYAGLDGGGVYECHLQ